MQFDHHTAITWWLTGLPAAGKTTLATLLCARLRALGEPACLLDGDQVRQGLSRDLTFSDDDRKENIRRVAEMSRLLNQSGIHAIVALVSPSRSARDAARAIVGNHQFREIHVATPLAVCQHRDPKKLYAQAANTVGMGMTGVDAPYEAPLAPALTLTHGYTPEQGVERLLLLRSPEAICHVC